jgi:glucose/arabinose dehydrogenase
MRTAAIAALLVPATTAGWQGNAFIGGLSSETLLRLILKGDKVDSEERIGVQRRIRDLIQAPDGTVLLLSDGKSGELLRLTPGDPRSGTR